MFFIDEVQEFLTMETEIMQEKLLKRFTQEIGQENNIFLLRKIKYRQEKNVFYKENIISNGTFPSGKINLVR